MVLLAESLWVRAVAGSGFLGLGDNASMENITIRASARGVRLASRIIRTVYTNFIH